MIDVQALDRVTQRVVTADGGTYLRAYDGGLLLNEIPLNGSNVPGEINDIMLLQRAAIAYDVDSFVGAKAGALIDASTGLPISGGGASSDATMSVGTAAAPLTAAMFGGQNNGVGTGGYPKRKTLATFESVASCLYTTLSGTGSRADDYSDPMFGDVWTFPNAGYGGLATNGKSLAITVSNFGKALSMPTTANTVAYDVSTSNIYLQMKMLTNNLLTNLSVRLYSTGTPALAGANYVQASFGYARHRYSGDWQTLGVPIDDFVVVGTGADLANITHAAIHVDTTSSSACTVLVGAIFACPKILNKASVSISFDDCRADTWTDAAKYMVRRGLPGVLYPGAISASLRANPNQFQLTLRQIELLKRLYGWQVAYQAFDTEAPVDTTDGFLAKMSKLHGLHSANGLGGGNDGSYFSGIGVNSMYDEVFRAQFRSMRSYRIYSVPELAGVHGEVVPFADPYNLKTIGVDTSAHSAANLTDVIARAVVRKSHVNFVFHGISIAGATFTGLIDYLDANRATVDVMTFDQLVMKINASSF